MVLLNLLVKPIYIFAIDRNVQNAVGDIDYGLFASLLNLSIIFNILLDLGITNFNNKSLAENTKRIKDYLPNMLVAKGVLSFLFVGILFCVGIFLEYDTRSFNLLIWIGFIQILNSFLLFLRSNVSAHHDFKIDSVLSVLDRLLLIGACSVLLFVPSFRENFVIEWFVMAQLASYGVSILFAMGVIVFRYAKIRLVGFQFSLVQKIIKESLPYALLILLMAIYMRSDQVILANVLKEDGEYQNGVYVKAFRILDALNMFGFLFAGMLLPMFSRMLAKKHKVSDLVRTTANILLPISLVIAANALYFKEDMIGLLYPKHTAVSSSIYVYVMLSFPAYCIMNIYSTLLTANGNLKILIWIAFVASVFSVGLNFYLIPDYKAISVAWVGLSVQWLAALGYIFYSIKKTDIELKLPWLLQFVFFFIAFCGVNYLLKFIDMPLLWAILMNVAIFIPLVFVVKLWNWQDLTKYFQELIVKDK